MATGRMFADSDRESTIRRITSGWVKEADESDKLGHVNVKPEDSASQTGSHISESTRVRFDAAMKRMELKIQADNLSKRHQIETQRMNLEKLRLQQHVDERLLAHEEEQLTMGERMQLAVAEEKFYSELTGDETIYECVWSARDKPDASTDRRAVRQSSTTKDVNPLSEHSVRPRSRDDHVMQPTEHEDTPRWKQEFEQSVQLQQQLVDVMQLPKSELMTFNGDPLRYWLFVRAFDNVVGRARVDDSAKLSRLLQYCEGKALKVIECCAVMHPSTGYRKARALLKERFGSNYAISEAWINKVSKGPGIRPSDRSGLQDFADELNSCIETLKSMERLTEMDTQRSMVRIVERLPYFLQDRWRKRAVDFLDDRGYYPCVEDLAKFISRSAREVNDPLFGVENTRRQDTSQGQKKPAGNKGKAANFTVQTSENGGGNKSTSSESSGSWKVYSCSLCGDQHSLFGCAKFKAMKPEDRLKHARDRRLCDNCLRPGHFAYNCGLNRRCSVPDCNKKHTKFLHIPSKTQVQDEPSSKSSTSEGLSNVHSGYATTNGNKRPQGAGVHRTVLPIVPVRVKVPSSNISLTTYALLDSGSSNSFCSQALSRRLGIKGQKTVLTLTTLEKADSKLETEVVALEVSNIRSRAWVKLPYTFVKSDLPVPVTSAATKQDVEGWPHLTEIDIENTDVDINAVTLLIGQDIPEALAPLEIRMGKQGEPYAARTILGWTVNGPISFARSYRAICHYASADVRLEDQVKKFWEMDNIELLADDSVEMSAEDNRAVEIWNRSLCKVDGHYQMDIPFRTRPPKLGDNLIMAENRLRALSRKLRKDPKLFQKYCSGIQELLNEGYAEKVTESIDSVATVKWYLPHHGVTSPSKPDKLRIVFDCAAKFDGTSLNEQVLQGPDLLNKLFGVLIRFREERVAVMSDIKAMYHQVRVTPPDRDVLRFLWWPNNDMRQPPEVHRMTVHLFGGIWSPSTANFALKRTAEDHALHFDAETVKTVDRNFYMDDCLKALAAVLAMIQLTLQLCQLLKLGGFRLTKWTSNRREVLEQIPESERAKAPELIELSEDRALGLKWFPHEDTLALNVCHKDKPLTRRGVLSTISSVYDPLGLTAPFVLIGKLILQELCRKGLSWDDPLPDSEAELWLKWCKDLPKLGEVKIDRCIKPESFENVVSYQIHNFCDGSTRGYGSVSFLRMVTVTGDIHCCLLTGKAKLAPLKVISVPRIELSAAVLAVKIIDQLLHREMDIPLEKSVFWTDSMLVLQYVQNESKRFQTFVANRISAIHAGSKPEQWRHVSTHLNPADIASRGVHADELLNDKTWWNGPDFLWQDESSWPVAKGPVPELSESDTEVKKHAKVYNVTIDNSSEEVMDRLINRYSSWYELKRAVALILRVKKALLSKVRTGKMIPSPCERLTVNELKDAEVQIVKYVQRQAYRKDIETLVASRGLKPSSSLYPLEPYLNQEGVLCVGGRLENARIAHDRKHPMIMPKDCHVATLIVRHYHELSGHSGREYVLSLMRERFWIVKVRTMLNRELSECRTCRRLKSKPANQKMSNLPSDRIAPDNPPFTFVGIDCFGPYLVKQGRSRVKRYGCLYTCLTLRAVHIEVLHSLDTDSFINGLQRFISRRGQPRKIRSDNATNFTSGNRELREAVADWNQDKIGRFLQQREIEWEYNPPSASHMGGAWERQIRTVRKILAAVTKEQVLDDESLRTLMCLAEGIVNGRPLTVVSDNVNDAEPLTPNHLLLLRSGPTLPPGLFCKQDIYRRRWRQIQYLADVFWRRWVREYLANLLLRDKWLSEQDNLKEGDVVLVTDEQTPRNLWPLGRVVETFAGRDGLVRSVRVKTKSTVLTRPVTKLCLLESG